MRIGRYEIVAQLAVGGMGRVSLAKATGEGGFERHVVIKSLDAVGIEDAEATAMFLDEARILGMLHHQHLAAIHEVGRDDEGRLFLVLEYVHGHTAHDLWERALDLGVHLPLDFTLTVIAAAAAGLHYAHTRRSPDGEPLGIVHRDVTLSNVMVGFDGTVKVIDFGIAKAALRLTQTQAGFIKGKLGYMAPEQLRGQGLDARADVFSLGIVLYELTTMRRAFREASDQETVARIKAGRYTRPSEIVPDYPPGLETIVTKALRASREERFASADELRVALERLGHDLHLVVGDAAVVDVMTRLLPDRSEPWRRRATTRAETESSIAVEWDDADHRITREVPPRALAVLRGDPDLPPRPPTDEAQPILQPRGQHREEADTTGELLAPPTAAVAGSPPAREPRAAREREETPVARSHRRLFVGTAIVAVAIAAGVLVYLQGRSTGSTPTAATAVADAPVVVPATVPGDASAPDAPVDAPNDAPTDTPTVDTAAEQPAARAGMVRVVVTSTPSDATVLLDGVRLGRTPFEGDVDVSPGLHGLKVRLNGYVAQKRKVEVVDQRIVESFELARGN